MALVAAVGGIIVLIATMSALCYSYQLIPIRYMADALVSILYYYFVMMPSIVLTFMGYMWVCNKANKFLEKDF